MQDCVETPTIVDTALDMIERGVPPVVVTNGDLVRKIRSLRVDLKTCSADKAALREWAADMK